MSLLVTIEFTKIDEKLIAKYIFVTILEKMEGYLEASEEEWVYSGNH